MDPHPRVLSLCAGIGGFELAVKAVWPGARVVCYVEWDSHAQTVLRDEIRAGRLDDAPIWDDARTFDGSPWRGCVDLVVAGYPCQGESNAGLRRGTDDERWLWDDVWRIVRDVGADWLAVENVAAHINRSWPNVAADLAAGGWRPEWDCVPAAAVGAPHRRDRVFALVASPLAQQALADTNSRRRESERCSWILDSQRPSFGHYADGCAREGSIAYADGPRLAKWQGKQGNDGAQQPTTQRGVSNCWWLEQWAPEPVLLRVDDGLPAQLDLFGSATAPDPPARERGGVAGGSAGAVVACRKDD